MGNLLGIHSVYSFTGRSRYATQSYNNMYLFEALTLLLSSYHWRTYNGPIKLICDDKFYSFIRDNSLEFIWDSIDVSTFKSLPNYIDYSIFWTYPKMFAHAKQTEPFTSIDADLYINRPIIQMGEDIIFGHSEIDDLENLYPDIYKSPLYSDLFLKYGEITHPAINTALVNFNNIDIPKELLEVATNFSKRITQYTTPSYNSWAWTIYVEQKVLGSLIVNGGYKFKSLCDSPYYGSFNTNGYTNEQFSFSKAGILHLWGDKINYMQNDLDRFDITNKLILEIEQNYPNLMDLVLRMKNIFKK